MKKLIATSSTVGGCIVAAILALVFQANVTLKTSNEGVAFIANLEGCKNSAYQCSADIWTIGLGHTSGTKEGDTASAEEIKNWFMDDIAKAEAVVNRHVTLAAGPEFDMAVSFVMNLGSGNFQSSTFLRKLQAGDFVGACDQITRWVYVDGKDCRVSENNCAGIVTRRAAEKNICLNGYRL